MNKGKSKKFETEAEKRLRESASDDSITSTPMKQQKISDLFVREDEGEATHSIQSIAMDVKRLENLLRKIIKEEVSKLTQHIETLTTENKNLKEDLTAVKKENLSLKNELNNLEQYTRRENVRIFGVEDNAWEDGKKSTVLALDILRNKMKIDIKEEDVEVAHRVGKFKSDRKRAIIVRFASRKTKEKVMTEKKKLKGSGIFVNEDLTKRNADWFFKVKRTEGVINAWTKNGETFVRNTKSNEIVKITKDYDLENLKKLLS